jgi:hypothetical protein
MEVDMCVCRLWKFWNFALNVVLQDVFRANDLLASESNGRFVVRKRACKRASSVVLVCGGGEAEVRFIPLDTSTLHHRMTWV